VQGAKTPSFSGRNLLCNLTKLMFEFIKSGSCGGLAVSEDAVSKNSGFSGVDKAQADDVAWGPPRRQRTKIIVGSFALGGCPYDRRQDTGTLLLDMGVTGLMIRPPPRLSSHRGRGGVLQTGYLSPLLG